MGPSRHVLSSIARRPGSWVRIPHKAWMFFTCMCLFCVVLCLSRDLATSWSPVRGILPSVKNYHETEKSALCSKVGARGKKKNIFRRDSPWSLPQMIGWDCPNSWSQLKARQFFFRLPLATRWQYFSTPVYLIQIFLWNSLSLITICLLQCRPSMRSYNRLHASKFWSHGYISFCINRRSKAHSVSKYMMQFLRILHSLSCSRKFSAYCLTHSFITTFTSVCHRVTVHPDPNFTPNWRFGVILLSRTYLSLLARRLSFTVSY
jgi:hypothetical protein